MMDETGRIVKLKRNTAIVMTEHADFKRIARKQGMEVSQLVNMREVSSRLSSYQTRLVPIAAALVFVLLAGLFSFSPIGITPVYAFVSVDINPSMELAIDENGKVLKVKVLNPDAEVLLTDLVLIGMPLEEAIAKIVQTAVEKGYLTGKGESAAADEEENGSSVLVSGALNITGPIRKQVSEEALDALLSKIATSQFTVASQRVTLLVIKLSPDELKSADGSHISMGKYKMYLKLKEADPTTTLEEVANSSVKIILEEIRALGIIVVDIQEDTNEELEKADLKENDNDDDDDINKEDDDKNDDEKNKALERELKEKELKNQNKDDENDDDVITQPLSSNNGAVDEEDNDDQNQPESTFKLNNNGDESQDNDQDDDDSNDEDDDDQNVIANDANDADDADDVGN